MKIQYFIAIHLLRWLTNFYDSRYKWTVTPGIGIHPTKAWLSHLANLKNAIWTCFPIVQTLLPVTFAYSLSSRKNLEAAVMRQLRKWKKLWRRLLTRSHKRTSMGPSRSCWNGTRSAMQPEEITINKSAHTKKSRILFNEPCILNIW